MELEFADAQVWRAGGRAFVDARAREKIERNIEMKGIVARVVSNCIRPRVRISAGN